MTHSDTVVDGDGIELGSIAAHLLNLLTHNLSCLMQMGVTRNELLNELTMAMIGLPNCSRFMPVATQRARAPAMRRPSVHTALLN